MSFFRKCAGGAHVDAFAATGAGFRRSPGLAQVSDDFRINAASHHVPGMRAFNLVTDANATRAQNAAVVIDDEALMRSVDHSFRVSIRKVNVGDAEFLRQELQVAVAVRNTYGTNVIALGKEQLDDHAAVVREPVGVRCDLHAFFDAGHARRQQFVRALHLHQAQTAGADSGKPLQFAEPRNEDLVLAGNVKNGFIRTRAEVTVINLERFDSTGWIHTLTSLNSFTGIGSFNSVSCFSPQTPAMHMRS